MSGFRSRYRCKRRDWFASRTAMIEAITFEKQIKDGPRQKKIAAIVEMNPSWRDPADEAS